MQWLKEIPSHWEERKMKYCFSERSEKNHPEEPILCATQSQGVIPQSMYANRVVVVNKGFEGLKLVREGDFVISLRSFEGGIEYAYYQGIISAAYTILNPQNPLFSNYWKLLFKSQPYIQLLQMCVTGIREGQNINYPMLSRSFIPLPPLAEQERIVSYLEDKTSKIDAYVAEKEKEILLLQELKQKTIADAVTKGLNPDVKMKDSGISWIGMIPEHWKQFRFATILKEKSICNQVSEELLSVYLDRGVIRFSDDSNKRTNPTSKDLSKYQLVEKGDFVLNNQQAWRGSVGVSRFRGIISPAYFIFSMTSLLDVNYANYLFRSNNCVAFYHICSKGIGSIQRNLDWGALRQKRIALPPLSEQRAIVAYIEEKCQKIDTLMTELQAEIDYMKEYKQRLIADCVTGQVNVQNETI